MRTFVALGAALATLLPLASAQVEVPGSLRHEYQVEPGATIEGSFQVLNPTDEPQEVRLYLVDFLFNHLNEYTYDEGAPHARSNRPWVRLPIEYVTVPPRDRSRVTYLINVPQSPAPPNGTYWSAIMVEPAWTLDPGFVPGEDEREVTMAHKVRYAVQVSTSLPDPGRSDIEFFDAEVARVMADSTDFAADSLSAPLATEAATQPYVLSIDMRNVGDAGLRPAVTVEVYDAAGGFVGEYEGRQRTLYPGTSTRQKIVLGNLYPGSYTAVVLADGGDDSLFGVRVPFDL